MNYLMTMPTAYVTGKQTWRGTLQGMPGFCGAAIFCEFFPVHPKDAAELKRSWVSECIENKEPKEIISAILADCGGAKLGLFDRIDGNQYSTFFSKFQEGDVIADRHGREFKVHFSEVYRNPNSGNEVQEMWFVRNQDEIERDYQEDVERGDYFDDDENDQEVEEDF